MSSNTPAFIGVGGYTTSNNVVSITETNIIEHDFTGSVKVILDVRMFNELIGIQKDAYNKNIISNHYFDNSNNVLINDSLTVTAEHFMKGLNMTGTTGTTSNIISVGIYTTFYKHFAKYITSYFGLPSAVKETQNTTTFSNDYNFLPNNGIFDKTSLLNIMNGTGVHDDVTGYINPLEGSIRLTDITAILRNSVTSNCFHNRDISSGIVFTDGFIDGDVIFIAGGGNNNDGIVLTMKLSVIPSYLSLDQTEEQFITRSLGTSLVIYLKNLSVCVLSVINNGISQHTIHFIFTGTFSSIIITRDNRFIKSFIHSPYIDSFIDYTLTAGTNYNYSFTPIDVNGYMGTCQLLSVQTII